MTAARPAAAPARNTTSVPTIPIGSPLLLLGRGADRGAERGVVCAGDLPAPDDPTLAARARDAKAALGERVMVLGHHYQRDQVIEFADARGDSFELSRQAATAEAPYLVFCGVHFMAESASILGREDQTVILPDLAAGCSMADMAEGRQVVDAWARLERAGVAAQTVPLTYMNSTAAIKSFCGEHGGAICTSSNAPAAMRWAFEQAPGGGDDGKVLFLPDQHLGRNTAVLSLGLSLDDCVVYDPWQPDGGLTDEQLREARVILWKGHCSVHARFQPSMVERIRAERPGVEVLVHPECRHEVVLEADRVGSTGQIIRWVEQAPAGATVAIATELNLVKRLAEEHPDKDVVFLDDTVCFCATMNRIDLPHLVWVLEALVAGEVVNEVRVDATTRRWARVALERMLALPGDGASLTAVVGTAS
ncbi:quinolinate synthase NadA [Egicoccus halophilus]|uniref:Quinolinate synthase n=1 Tax=Egicoccus halophilus TaxID=1670830 RepID=A0A8J3A905_9ACTN|nr:quinolinate synthase NadA [Egicoccus halophilus]GGI07197.1 quinolinate synthase A [Egicoccus halophilus]